MLHTLSTMEESNPTPINNTTSPATTSPHLQQQHQDEDPVLFVDVADELQRGVPMFQQMPTPVEVTHIQFYDRAVDVPVWQWQRRPRARRMPYNTQYTHVYEKE